MTTTRGMEENTRGQFDAWRRRELSVGIITDDMSEGELWCKFNIHCVRKAEEELSKERLAVKDSYDGRKERRELDSFRSRRELEAWKCLKAFGKSVTILDGTDKGALREWVEVVERVGKLAQVDDYELIKFAISNASGTLHEILSNALLGEQLIKWVDIKDIINDTLLTADERSYLRNLIFTLKQGEGETTAVYCHRFKKTAAKGWELEKAVKGSDIFDILLSTFLDSLLNDTTMWYIETQIPSSLEQAFKYAIISDRSVDRQKKRVAVVVSTSEVSVLDLNSAKNKYKEDTALNSIKTLQGEVKSLRKVIDRLSISGDCVTGRGVSRDIDSVAGVQPYGDCHVRQRAAVAVAAAPRRTAVGQHQCCAAMHPQHTVAYDRVAAARPYQATTHMAHRRYTDRHQVGTGNRSIYCFCCGGPHFVRDCPNKYEMSGN